MANVQEEISRVILGLPGKADRFTLRWGWLRFRLAIRPISTGNMLKISAELSNVKPVDENGRMIPVFFENVTDILYYINSIVIATETRYPKIIRKALLKLPLSDIQTLFAIVIKQCDAKRFFFIYNSWRDLKPMKIQTEQQ